MKKSKWSITCIALIIFSSLVSTSAISQAGQEPDAQKIAYYSGNHAEWAESGDAVTAAPNNHKILLENDQFRMLEVTLLPGQKEPVHHHRWPSVLYILAAGDFIDYDGEGKVIFDTRTLKTPLVFPMAMYKEPGAPHAVENLSKTITIKFIRVEKKQ